MYKWMAYNTEDRYPIDDIEFKPEEILKEELERWK